MTQRIAVRILLERRQHPLLLRRAEGRQSILGKYELPGGRVELGEQPENAAQRYVRDDVGIVTGVLLQLVDVLTYSDADDRNIQYAVVIYRAVLTDEKRLITLSHRYDKYIWYQPSRVAADQLTGLTQYVLDIAPSAAAVERPALHDTVPLLYTDGGSRGNPGPSAAGYILFDQAGEIVGQGGEYLGVTTNNQAEYQAVHIGLEAALARGWRTLECRLDSMLVVNQLNGVYKIKNRELWPVYDRVQELIARFEKVTFVHVPRQHNQLADGMVNKTLDAAQQALYNKDAVH